MQMSHNWHLSILFHFWKAFWYIHMLGQKSSSNKFHRAKIIQFSSVAQSCLTLCDLMNHSTSGLPVHNQLQESTQTHIHWVSDAIQPSHPLSSPSPPFLNLSQNQGLFKWVSSSHQVAKVLEFQLQHHPGLISFPPKEGRASNLC